MNDAERPDPQPAEVKPPFLYEIRVKGRLSNERWTAWFDESTVSTSKGDTTLRGSVPDHAALYGLLGKLRDLAVPLVSVRVLDAEAQRKLGRQIRTFDLMIHSIMTIIYLLLTGGLIAITVFAAEHIHTALALMLLFAAVAGLAHAFRLWNELPIWRWIAYIAWVSCGVSLIVLVATSGLLHPALAVAASLFLAAAGMAYLASYLRRRFEGARDRLVETVAPQEASGPADSGSPDAAAAQVSSGEAAPEKPVDEGGTPEANPTAPEGQPPQASENLPGDDSAQPNA